MLHAVWIEIPVNDLERAMAFYQAVFELQPTEIVDDGVRRTTTLINTGEDKSPGISLNKTANFHPGDKGPLVYLNVGSECTSTLARVEGAGGKIVESETSMGSAGYYATILDTEGNLLALYAYR